MMRREEEDVDALLEWAVSSLIQIRISKLKTSMSTKAKVPNDKFFVYKKSFNRLIMSQALKAHKAVSLAQLQLLYVSFVFFWNFLYKVEAHDIFLNCSRYQSYINVLTSSILMLQGSAKCSIANSVLKYYIKTDRKYCYKLCKD